MLLKDWLTNNKKKVTDFALEIGVTRDCVQKYMSGQRRPNDEHIVQKIFKVTNGQVTLNDFYNFPKIRNKKQ